MSWKKDCRVTVAILKQKLRDHYRLYVSIFIFIIILCCLYLPFYRWGLFADDFGIIRHVMDVGFKKIWTFFYEGETFSAVLNPNYVNTLDNFLGGLYRPMVFIYSLLQVHFFGPNPSAYLFVSIFLHSLNSVFLFNIIYTFEKTFAAVVLALCREKGLVLLTFISCAMFSWIPILLTHQPRYLYVGLFFFMISLALLYHFSDLNKNCKKCLFVLVLAYISIN